jgi:hypothetical protein
MVRATGVANQYLVVAEDTLRNVAAGQTVRFETRISANAGDVVALYGNGYACLTNGTSGFSMATATDVPVGSTTTTTPPVGSQSVVLQATLEADADGDGYGDETQDKCPSRSDVQGACPDTVAPAATLSGATRQNVAKQGSVNVTVRSSEAGTATATGTLNIPGASKVFALKPASATVAANTRAKLVLKLSRSARKALRKALARKRKPTARVTVAVEDDAGNEGTAARRVTVTAGATGKKRRH